MTESIPIWLDCDTGHDDAFALLLAARHPSLQLLGVSTVYGNASLTNTTYNTRAILKAIGREDIPVHIGASKPFCREAACAPQIHGESGLDGTTCLPTPTIPAIDSIPAIDAIYKALASQPPDTIWLVATGSLTNIALLFAIYPSLASHIAGLSIMGGAIGNNFSNAPMGTANTKTPSSTTPSASQRIGNHTPWAEFNIYIDPESAAAIFSNPLLQPKTTLIPLDLTHQFIATPDVLQMMLHGPVSPPQQQQEQQQRPRPTQVRRLFHEILTFFAGTYASVFGIEEGPPTHDPLAVAVIFAPELFDDRNGERFMVDVVTDGEHGATKQVIDGQSQCGRTLARLLAKGEPGVRIPRSLDTSQAWEMLDQCLSRAERAVHSSR